MEATGIEMKLNGLLIKQLRENRAWSQEHLATIAGVSLRTIQRVENGHSASAETRMALASAFDIQIGDLEFETERSENLVRGNEENGLKNSPAEPMLHRQVSIRHFFIYAFVCGGLIILNLSQSGGLTWVRYPLIIWGGVLLIKIFLRRGEKSSE